MIYVDKYAYISKLKNRNPGIKSLFTLANLMIVLSIPSIPMWIAVIGVMMALSVHWGKVPFYYYCKLMTLPAAFLMLSVIGIILNISGEAVAYPSVYLFRWYFYITGTGLRTAVTLVLRAMASVSSLYFLILSTPMSELLAVLKKVKAPPLMLELLAFVYRFIFILMEIAATKQNAIKSRFGYSNLRAGYQSFGMLAGSVFIQSQLRSQSIYQAMAARGYDKEYKVLTAYGQVQKKEISALILYCCIMILLGITTKGVV